MDYNISINIVFSLLDISCGLVYPTNRKITQKLQILPFFNYSPSLKKVSLYTTVMSGENSHESVIHLLKSVSHRVNFRGGGGGGIYDLCSL